MSWLPARNRIAQRDPSLARGDRAWPQGEMGSEGRAWNGAGVAAGSGGVEAKAITAAVSAAEVPRLAVSVDISLPLPEMSPDIM